MKTPDIAEPGVDQLSRDGMMVGTPGFMAPEIVMGKTDVDARVDLYAVGTVAYWLLTGQRLFQCENPMLEAMHHIQSEPVPPSQRTDMDIPDALEKVIIRCLEKDPADRPQSGSRMKCSDTG